jgi:hypothetical protein
MLILGIVKSSSKRLVCWFYISNIYRGLYWASTLFNDGRDMDG